MILRRAVRGQSAHQGGGSQHVVAREDFVAQASWIKTASALMLSCAADGPCRRRLGAAPEAACINDVIGRIVSFLVLPNSAAGQAVPFGRILAQVRLYAPVPLGEMKTAAAAVETELWNHNYTFINHKHFTAHVLPAHLIGPLVVVMPYVQRSIAKLGYCLVLQES